MHTLTHTHTYTHTHTFTNNTLTYIIATLVLTQLNHIPKVEKRSSGKLAGGHLCSPVAVLSQPMVCFGVGVM